MPLSIRRAKARATALLDALAVGETWAPYDAQRAFRQWSVVSFERLR